MSGGSFDTVSVIDATFPCLVIDIKVLEIIVEIHRAGAEVATEQSGVCGENGTDVNVSLAAEENPNCRLPLVKMGDDGMFPFVRSKLREVDERGKKPRRKESIRGCDINGARPCGRGGGILRLTSPRNQPQR